MVLFDNVRAKMNELETIQPGEVVVYHTGASLPAPGSHHFGIAKLARKLAREGKLYLFQRRTEKPVANGVLNRCHGIGEFEYVAVGAKRRIPPSLRP